MSGVHSGRIAQGDVRGTIDGNRIEFRSSGRYEGASLSYKFTGTVAGNRMSGEVDLGEYGKAHWMAQRPAYA